MAISYELPKNWVDYRRDAVFQSLANAKAAMLTLVQMPYQRSWADQLQELQLKREIAGTSRIEGAEFSEKELDAALRQTLSELATRSQRQAAAAVATYRWIAGLPADRPVDGDLIREVHRRLVTGCDDDHCPPGLTRRDGDNVTFGTPRHRGVEGGDACIAALGQLGDAVRTTFHDHDPLVQALALHYHFAAMHPFLDGNGRTARALEALLLQRVGLRDTLFIAMSNYYYEEKDAYLKALTDTRAAGHDLSPFLEFALKGIELQCRRLFGEIRQHVVKALYRNTVTELFVRLKSPRKRVMSARHVQLLNLLLDEEEIELTELTRRSAHFYVLKTPAKALIRDLSYLLELEAIRVARSPLDNRFMFSINLDWPTQITETEFFRRVRNMPKGKIHAFLATSP